MKLIDILVQELPGRGGWNERWHQCAQDGNGEVCFFTSGKIHFRGVFDAWSIPSDSVARHDGKSRIEALLADDYAEAIITREQYEAALAASKSCAHDWIPSEGRTASGYLCRKCGDYNGPELEAKKDADGWIDWGGGECPVDTKTLVDIKLKDGFTYKSCHAGDYSWRHGWHNVDIIAYRLHKPQEETEADGEADLNECIGQDAATAWDRDGIPPVGCECEFMKYERGYHEKWRRGTVMYVSGCTVVIDDHNPGEVVGHPCNFQFRPLSSEADKKRGAICDAIYGALTKAEREHNRSDEAEAVYDAIAAGKIPGVKLEG